MTVPVVANDNWRDEAADTPDAPDGKPTLEEIELAAADRYHYVAEMAAIRQNPLIRAAYPSTMPPVLGVDIGNLEAQRRQLIAEREAACRQMETCDLLLDLADARENDYRARLRLSRLLARLVGADDATA